MKRNYLKLLGTLFFSVAAMTACSDYDEIYLLTEVSEDEEVAEYQQTIKLWSDSIKHFKERVMASLAKDKENPVNYYADFAPDFTETLADGSTIGYVDMGTSVYWAVMNVGDEIQPLVDIDSLYYYPEEPQLNTTGMAKSMPLLDYLNKKETGSNQQLVDEYVKACKSYMEKDKLKYRQFCNLYINQFSHLVSINAQLYYWGVTEKYAKDKPVQINTATLPMELSGASNDAATSAWGGKWKTPSVQDFKDLLATCTVKTGVSMKWKYLSYDNTIKSGVQYGTVFQSKKTGKYLYLPTFATKSSDYSEHQYQYLTSHRLDDIYCQVFVIGKEQSINFRAKITEQPGLLRPVRTK